MYRNSFGKLQHCIPYIVNTGEIKGVANTIYFVLIGNSALTRITY